MKITKEDLNEYSNEIFEESSNFSSEKQIKNIKENFNKNYEEIYPDTLNYCVNQFIQTELDFTTLSNRGIGRLTETLPRLGSYFRGPISKLNKSDLDNLDTLTTKLIIKTYLFCAVIMGQPEEKTKSFTKEELYREWIPKIFTSSLSLISENAGKTLLGVVEKDLKQVETFFKLHDMNGGGLFSRDKSKDILVYYIVAGLVLYNLDKLKN